MGVAWRLGECKDEKAKQTRRGRVVAWRCRLKREDCPRTPCDSAFYKWEILIGPSDWNNHSLGKDGAERYRTSNLPHSCSCPGIYELGVARLSTSSRRFDSKDIVVVYLGQAENVSTRLQHYGRTGSHLEHGDSSVLPDKIAGKVNQRRPGLFKDVFSKGFSIMFRWAPVRSKRDAVDAEARLLEEYDYAWNRIGNAAYRYEDISSKLEKLSRSSSPLQSFLTKLKPWNWKLFRSKGEQRPEERRGKRGSRIKEKGGRVKGREARSTVCAVVMEGGAICSNAPPRGRKRCHLHKGRRIGTSGG